MVYLLFCVLTMMFSYLASMFLEQLEGGLSYAASENGQALGSRLAAVAERFHVNEYHWAYFAVLLIISLIISYFLTRFLKKYAEGSPVKSYMILHAVLYGAIFVSYGRFSSNYDNYGFDGVDLSFLNRALIFAAEIAAICLISYCCKHADEMSSYRKKWPIVGRIAVSVYIAFALIGRSLFFGDEKAWVCSESGLVIFLMMILWIQPFIEAVLIALHRHAASGQKAASDHKTAAEDTAEAGSVQVDGTGNSVCVLDDRKFRRIIFLISMGIGLIWLAACNPLNFPLDAVVAWKEISGQSMLSVSFPVMIKAFYRLVYLVIPYPWIIGVIQIVISSLLIGMIAGYFCQKGVSQKKLIIACVIFMAIPTNGLFIVTFTSNFYYTAAIVWVTYILIRYGADAGYLADSIPDCIALGLSLLLMYYGRNEGRYVALVLAAILFVVMICRRSWKMTAGFAVLAAGICLIDGVFMNTVQIDKSDFNSSAIQMDMIWAVERYGGRMPESVKSSRDASELYTEYDYDSYADNGLSGMNDDELMKAFIDCIKMNPGIALRERLNKSDLVWNITEGTGSHNVREITFVADNDIGVVRHDNLLTVILVKILYPITIVLCVLDMMLYRSGIWIAVSLIFLLYWGTEHRMKHHFLELLPAYGHAGILMLSLLWQCSRHVYCIQLSIALVIVSELISKPHMDKDIR